MGCCGKHDGVGIGIGVGVGVGVVYGLERAFVYGSTRCRICGGCVFFFFCLTRRL